MITVVAFFPHLQEGFFALQGFILARVVLNVFVVE